MTNLTIPPRVDIACMALINRLISREGDTIKIHWTGSFARVAVCGEYTNWDELGFGSATGLIHALCQAEASWCNFHDTAPLDATVIPPEADPVPADPDPIFLAALTGAMASLDSWSNSALQRAVNAAQLVTILARRGA